MSDKMMAKMEISDAMSEILTVQQAAQLLQVDDATIRRWIKQGVLEAFALPQVGTREKFRIKKSTIDALMDTPARAAKEQAG